MTGFSEYLLRGLSPLRRAHLFVFLFGGAYSINYVVYLIRTKNKMQNHFFYDLFYKKVQKTGRWHHVFQGGSQSVM